MIRSPGDIGALIGDENGLWAVTGGGRVLRRVDTRSRELGDQFALDVSPYWFAPTLLDGAIWASDPHDPALLRIDPQYGRVAAKVDLPRGQEADGPQNAQGVAVTRDAVWTAYGYPKRIARYTPSTGKVATRRIDNGTFFDGLVAAEGDVVWVVDREGRRLLRVDPDTLAVEDTAKLHGGFVEDARVYRGSLWVAMQGDGGVWRIDRNGDVLGKIETGDVPYSLAIGAGSLWVANANSGTVTKIDPETAESRSFTTGHRPIAVGVSGDDVWVFAGLGAADARARVSGSNVVRQAAVGNPYWNLDPVTCCSPLLFALQWATGARLTDYVIREDGTAAVEHSVAAAEPRTTDGGRTWEFRIGKGYRFSPPSGEPVTAETFRYTIERALSPKLSNSYCRDLLLPDVAGLEPFSAGKTQHISGLTGRDDRLTIRLTAPSWTLPARLAMPCFTAVPIGTPIAPDGLEEPIPSAGPYYVDYNLGDFQLVVKKNPNYGGPRPQGVDGLVVTESLSAEQAGGLVEQGKADWVVDESEPPAAAFAPGGRYSRLYGSGPAQRYFRRPANGTRYLLFNTTAGPLTDVRLRRAIAFALDRRKLAEIVDGSPRALLLPPGIPGYGTRDALGHGPALARARSLVGGRHPRLLLVANVAQQVSEPLARELRKELGRIGIDLRVRLDADPWGIAKSGHPRVDIFMDGWFADYPDAFSYVSTLLDPKRSGNFYPEFFRDRRWVERIRAASRVSGPAREAAYRRLDHDLADGPVPVTAMTVGQGLAQLFSARVKCHTVLPLFGSIADPTSLCLE